MRKQRNVIMLKNLSSRNCLPKKLRRFIRNFGSRLKICPLFGLKEHFNRAINTTVNLAI